MLILLLSVALVAAGWWALERLPMDAYPDLSPPMVDIVTQWPGHSAEEVERLISVPVERAMSDVPDMVMKRSVSLYGLSDVTLTFRMPRPKSHYWTGRRAHELRPDAPTWHTSRPDVDKLTRAVLDALSGVWWVDDSQVAMVTASKAYSDDGAPGVHIIAEVLP